MRVTVERMVDVMLVDSDNTAADSLCASSAGRAPSRRTSSSRGVAGIRISLDEKGMGAAMKKNLAAFEKGARERREPGRDGGAPRPALPRRAALARLDGPHPRRDAPVRDRRPAAAGGTPEGHGGPRQDRDRRDAARTTRGSSAFPTGRISPSPSSRAAAATARPATRRSPGSRVRRGRRSRPDAPLGAGRPAALVFAAWSSP